jgi:hypothetical protein
MIAIKIKSIKKLEKKEDVYDLIGVPDNHNFIANNMVVHNCDLFGRGVGALYVKDKNPVMDSWRMKEFNLVGSYTEFTDLSKVEKMLKKHPNFWQIVKFPKPPAWLYNRYLLVREANVYDDDNVLKNVSREDIHNALLVLTLRDIITDSATHTINRITLHIKNTYDINLTKQMIQETINDARQLVQKIKEKAISYDATKTEVELIQTNERKGVTEDN